MRWTKGWTEMWYVLLNLLSVALSTLSSVLTTWKGVCVCVCHCNPSWNADLISCVTLSHPNWCKWKKEREKEMDRGRQKQREVTPNLCLSLSILAFVMEACSAEARSACCIQKEGNTSPFCSQSAPLLLLLLSFTSYQNLVCYLGSFRTWCLLLMFLNTQNAFRFLMQNGAQTKFSFTST